MPKAAAQKITPRPTMAMMADQAMDDHEAPAAPPQRLKPTLWQRIWYGANAEQRLALKTVPVRDSLSEVKAGVLAEMQAMAQNKGGVSGSPFATVMLPQQARRFGKATTAAAPAKPASRGGGWLLGLVLLLGVLWVFWQVRLLWPTPAATTPLITMPSPDLLPPPVAASAPQPAPVDLLAAKPTLMRGQALGALVQAGAPTAARVANGTNQLMVAVPMLNRGAQPLAALQWQLTLTDQRGVMLLQRTLPGVALAAGEARTERFTLSLNGRLERLVATVPLKALKVSLTPLQATR